MKALISPLPYNDKWNNRLLDAPLLQKISSLAEQVHPGNAASATTPGPTVKNEPVIFYGAPGTGKKQAASLLAKYTRNEVHRVDLSALVSKYIGETEKNLDNVFSQVAGKNWILFFDEGDALFGKRSSVSDSHDKYANQEVAYLLQKVESYQGKVIISVTGKKNIDDAFLRRFRSVVQFPKPIK